MEVGIVLHIIAEPSLWDHDRQVVMALRYILFVIDQVMCLMVVIC
jgi:hypothetical protein